MKIRKIVAFLTAGCMVCTTVPVFDVSVSVSAKTTESSQGCISGTVSGFLQGDENHVLIVLRDKVNAYQTRVNATGEYIFADIPDGNYELKCEADGYETVKPIKCKVKKGEAVTQDITLVPISHDNAGDKDDHYHYQWNGDDDYFGHEQSSDNHGDKKVDFQESDAYISTSHASLKLWYIYHIVLSNEELRWSNEYASRMLDLIGDIHNFGNDKPSKWVLTEEELANDIEVAYYETYNEVRISTKAFGNAIPRKGTLDERKGTYYSNRLYHALVRYATKDGEDLAAVDEILRNDFGCTIMIEDYEELTKHTTKEGGDAFMQFKPEELLTILELFEELPQGFHTTKGLDYLVRRAEGTTNPEDETAATVSWTFNNKGYIEFMDNAFDEQEDKVFEYILRAKAEFLWETTFSNPLKKEWKEATDILADDSAKTAMTAGMVAYVLNGATLEAESPQQFAFIRDYIMNGEIYVKQNQNNLSFEVYNLYPEWNHPGRVTDVQVDVEGAVDEDKKVTITVSVDNYGNPALGAGKGFMRIMYENGNFYDVWLVPTDDTYSVLQGEVTFSKYAPSGMWYCECFQMYDVEENQTFDYEKNFGWKLYIDNELQDLEKPQYIPESIQVEIRESEEDDRVPMYIDITFQASDDVGLNSCYCEITNKTYNGYRRDYYGSVDNETGLCTVSIPFTEYYQSGVYEIGYLSVTDYAGNSSGYTFGEGEDAYEPATTFTYESELSDYAAPELDISGITITATPTNPEVPDGETLVEIDYYVKDNVSGLGTVSYELTDPLGNSYMEYHYHENFYELYFNGDPTVWTKYHISVVLPKGSAPGTWCLSKLYLSDKAGNDKTYTFEASDEQVHFVTEDKDSKHKHTYVGGYCTRCGHQYLTFFDEWKYVCGIKEKTSISMCEQWMADSAIAYDEKHNKLDDKERNLKTGDILKFGKMEDEYTVCIKGDICADGVINVLDMEGIQKHLLQIAALEGVYKDAASIVDEQSVSVLDMETVQKHILKIEEME